MENSPISFQPSKSPLQPPSLERFYPLPDEELGIGASEISQDARMRHYHRYITVSQFLKDYGQKSDIIVDVGCGSGYGTDLLSKHHRYVIGIEPNDDARKYASKHFPHLKFTSDLEGADSVVMVESIEHMTKAEVRSYVHGARLVCITTPLIQNPMNEYHVDTYKHPDDISLMMKKEAFNLLEERVERSIVFTTGEVGDQYYGAFRAC